MQVVLYKRNKNNKLYYYSIDDRQQSLFHPHAISIRWGASPDGGREKQYFFNSETEKNKKIRGLLKDKLKIYQVLYSYFKDRSRSAGVSTMDGPEDILSRIG